VSIFLIYCLLIKIICLLFGKSVVFTLLWYAPEYSVKKSFHQRFSRLKNGKKNKKKKKANVKTRKQERNGGRKSVNTLSQYFAVLLASCNIKDIKITQREN